MVWMLVLQLNPQYGGSADGMFNLASLYLTGAGGDLPSELHK